MESSKLQRLIGSLFIVGFDGTVVTPHVKCLIKDHFVGAILLSAKNVSSAGQASQLIKELQEIAHQAGHTAPLLIAIDQENGSVNSIFDDEHIRQLPSAMAMVACNSLELTREVAATSAKEMRCVGINWILGPVLDVLSNVRTQPLGVRSLGDNATEVAEYGLEYINGYHDGGIATCGKHFPSYGNLEFLGSPLDIPIVSGSVEQLRLSALVPFEKGIQGRLDAMLVGACAMPQVTGGGVAHACLSKSIVDGLLRSDLGFEGVVMAECLEIESLYDNLGVGQATIMGLDAGCDMFMVCNSFSNQLEAISGVQLGLESDIITIGRIEESAARVSKLKAKYTDWSTALNPPGIEGLKQLKKPHLAVSQRAYETSISLVRDQGDCLPLAKSGSVGSLVLLTPLVESFFNATEKSHSGGSTVENTNSDEKSRIPKRRYFEGEETFRGLGLSLARRWPGKVLHTSYTANGIRPTHEDLISSAAVVIVVTADSVRNLYQYGFTKYVASLCKSRITSFTPRGISCIVVAASSPFDFIKDIQIGTYICTYDFTPPALNSLVRVLFGDLPAVGMAPSTKAAKGIMKSTNATSRPTHLWLVEKFDASRDLEGLQELLDKVHFHSSRQANNSDAGFEAPLPIYYSGASLFVTASSNIFDSCHFVVRNSSTKALYGFCATYYLKQAQRGSIGCLLVDPERRRLGIGGSLYSRSTKYLLKSGNIRILQFGSDLPGIFFGIPSMHGIANQHLKRWLEKDGWRSNILCASTQTYTIRDLSQWLPPDGLLQRFKLTQTIFKSWQEPITPAIREHFLSHLTSTRNEFALRRPSILQQVYEHALLDLQGCSVLVMQSSQDNSIVGSALLYGPQTTLGSLWPTGASNIGGIAGIVIRPGSQELLLTQSLLAMAITQFRSRNFSGMQIHMFENFPSPEALKGLGFECSFEFKSMARLVDVPPTSKP